MPSLETISVLIAAASAVFAGFQVLLSRRASEEEFNWRKKDRVSRYSVFTNAEYRAARDRVTETFGAFSKRSLPIPVDEVLAAIEKDATILTSILTVISHWQRLASDIRHDLVDEDYAFQMHGLNLAYAYAGFAGYIERRSSSGRVSFPTFSELGKDWAKRKGVGT